MLISSDFVLKYKSKPIICKLDNCSHWNNNIFISQRKCLDVDVTLHININLCMPALKQNVLQITQHFEDSIVLHDKLQVFSHILSTIK